MYLLNKKVLFSVLMLIVGIAMVSNEAIAQEESQARLWGQVTDSSTDQPVPNVEVMIVDLNESATTDEEGNYSFEMLQPGTYTVSVEADGYESWQQEVEIMQEEETTLDIELNPSMEMEEGMEDSLAID
jgi:uncharacterized membrane protein